MSGLMSRNKGKRAEREVVNLLQPIVNKVYAAAGKEAPSLERNLMQSHKGGHDIVGLEWMALEVKHQEALQVNAWWKQTEEQAKRIVLVGELSAQPTGQGGNPPRHPEPVLFFRKNNARWQVVVKVKLALGDGRHVSTHGTISLEAFLIWFEHKLGVVIAGQG